MLFKVVFGSQRYSEALRGLLNGILGLQGDHRIAEVTLLNPVREKEYLHDKGTILDVKARDGQGRVYNIEVQLQEQENYRERSVYYAANMIGAQIETGQDYRYLKPTIQISLVDFVLFDDFADLHSIYRLYDKQHGRTLGNLLEIHYVEIAEFRKQSDQLTDSLERWLYFLRQATSYEDVTDLPETLQKEEGIIIAMKATHNALSDEEVRYAIEARQKWELDRLTELNIAVERGEARGEVRGEARGRAESAKEIAKELLAMGQSEEVVFRATGLKPEDL